MTTTSFHIAPPTSHFRPSLYFGPIARLRSWWPLLVSQGLHALLTGLEMRVCGVQAGCVGRGVGQQSLTVFDSAPASHPRTSSPPKHLSMPWVHDKPICWPTEGGLAEQERLSVHSGVVLLCQEFTQLMVYFGCKCTYNT
jgi:hypothetical protein